MAQGHYFHQRLRLAGPPSTLWPDDLTVPFTDFGDMVRCMSIDLQVASQWSRNYWLRLLEVFVTPKARLSCKAQAGLNSRRLTFCRFVLAASLILSDAMCCSTLQFGAFTRLIA
eukprot:4936777-Amphidinium_carterae.1